MKKMSTFFLLLGIGGCSGVRHLHTFKPPETDMPASFKAAHARGNFESEFDWWHHFRDAQLNRLIDIALENNYDIQIADEKITELYDTYRVQFARFFPSINLTTNIDRIGLPRDIPFFRNDGLRNPSTFYQAGFYTFWEIDLWGRIAHAKNAAYYDMQAQAETLHDTMLTILSEVARTYIQICAVNEQINLYKNLLQVAQDYLALETDLYGAGLDNQVPQLQEDIDVDQVNQQLVILNSQKNQLINSLAYLLGEYPQDFRFDASRATIPVSAKKPQPGLPSQLLTRRPDIRRAEQNLAAAFERVGQAQADWFPQFSLLATANSIAQNTCQWFKPGSLLWIFGPSFNWPIITFGQITYQVKATESAERQACLAYAQTVTNALKEVENYLIAYFQATQESDIIRAKLEAARAQVALYSDRFCAGLDSKLTQLQAIKNQLTIEIEYSQSMQNVSTSLVALYKALGGGW